MGNKDYKRAKKLGGKGLSPKHLYPQLLGSVNGSEGFSLSFPSIQRYWRSRWLLGFLDGNGGEPC